MNSHRIEDNRKLEARRQPPMWFDAGIGLYTLEKLAKRAGKGWEDGVFHEGGINTGHWLVLHNKTGRRMRAILALYASRDEFLNDV